MIYEGVGGLVEDGAGAVLGGGDEAGLFAEADGVVGGGCRVAWLAEVKEMEPVVAVEHGGERPLGGGVNLLSGGYTVDSGGMALAGGRLGGWKRV